MAYRIKDLLTQRASENFVGRQAEVNTLLDLLADDASIVMHVHGIGGIGKTRLLEAFANQARARGVVVLILDCRTLEPSPAGFLRALGLAIGGRCTRRKTRPNVSANLALASCSPLIPSRSTGWWMPGCATTSCQSCATTCG